MSHIAQEIEKICKFAFNYSNLDTLFINSHSQVKWDFAHQQVPKPLNFYFENMQLRLNLHDNNLTHDILFHSSSYKISFISARLFDERNYIGSIVVGPYLLEEPSALMIRDILFENQLSITLMPLMEQYYLSLPLIGTYKAKNIAEFLAYLALNLPQTQSKVLSFGDINYDFQKEFTIIPDTIKQNNEPSIAHIEARYRSEKEMMSVIENGDMEKLGNNMEKEMYFFSKVPDRIPNDPLRSRKNLSFVTNTVLRIASEKGGLHPVYIDSISKKFAIQIEKTTTIQQLTDLRSKMYIEYCDAVRKLSVKKYNRVIQKAIDYIRLHLDQDLTLQNIASAIQSSTFELSRQFNTETGHSITEYINNLRINEALKIMENENFSITDIAQIVGFNDGNYFTKVFKKITGMTPSQYKNGKRS
jgi:two-component system, response regulator YesN